MAFLIAGHPYHFNGVLVELEFVHLEPLGPDELGGWFSGAGSAALRGDRVCGFLLFFELQLLELVVEMVAQVFL